MNQTWKNPARQELLDVFSSLADMLAAQDDGEGAVPFFSHGQNTPTATVDFASSAIGKSSAAQISSMLSGMQERGGSYTINLVVDGRTLANVVFDPLSGVAKQKGVTLGA
ncbi:MAG: hypothetical protein IJC71_01760 [Clostridia bacterium]|nr:hypothetical protein [Clostridia bacterium]